MVVAYIGLLDCSARVGATAYINRPDGELTSGTSRGRRSPVAVPPVLVDFDLMARIRVRKEAVPSFLPEPGK